MSVGYVLIDEGQRAYNNVQTVIVLLLGSTRCSSVDCVGVPLRISSIMANSWYQALAASTSRDYNDSITNCGSYWNRHDALKAMQTVWM